MISSKSILQIRQSEAVAAVLHQSANRGYVPTFLEFWGRKCFSQFVIVDSKVKFALLGVETNFDDVSRSIAFLKVDSVFI